jgi:NAD(P)-dependent dehydrogenase (short-subunit alcohol dehydrogenase family)
MNKPHSGTRSVLITGGTSGLGLELVRLFLARGFEVVVTGRRQVSPPAPCERFKLVNVDFSNLEETAGTVNKICDSYNFDVVINNAGVLGPGNLIVTGNGHEYTFQVNFLAHLLVNEIIIRKRTSDKPLTTAVITSLVYRIAGSDIVFPSTPVKYRPFKAYTRSKLFLALMCGHLTEKYLGANVKCIGFDPGVFSSGIFRMQNRFYRAVYDIGAPFMRDPLKVAAVLSELIDKEDLTGGSVYDLRKRIRRVPEVDSAVLNDFWEQCDKSVAQFL